MSGPRVAVIGCGSFGRNHLRVVSSTPGATLTLAIDSDLDRAQKAAAEFGAARPSADWRDAIGHADAAIIAAPTTAHAEIGTALLAAGLDILVEKPIADSSEGAQRLVEAGRLNARILQVGHLERFNPAVVALRRVAKLPLFFEIHRMNQFAPRSLDVDVVLDLMIHDIDLVLALTGQMPEEVRAAGIRILSEKVDIANVRLAFPNGCVANLTASRVSTERVRKMRMFQPHQYISVDYGRQDGVAFTVGENRQIGFEQLSAERKEPLVAQWEAFLECVRTRQEPQAGGEAATRALAVCLDILDKIEVHAERVNLTLSQYAV